MIQGLTLAAQGMTVIAQKQEQIAHNLANINTTGFKESSLFAKSFQKYVANSQQEPFANREITADEVFIDYSQGTMKSSHNDLDVAIQGSGFFSVMTKDGTRYTRNGNFSVGSDGTLVTANGDKVMGKGGVITINQKGGAVRINGDGEIMQGSDSRGILRIAEFPKPYKMTRDGNGLFAPLEGGEKLAEKSYEIRQGFLEGSNVSPIRSMVAMIGAYRNFEADQKALHSQDVTLDKAVNVIGRV